MHRHIKKGRCRGHPSLTTQMDDQQGYEIDVREVVANSKEDFEMHQEENKGECLRQRFPELQAADVDHREVTGDYGSTSTSVMLEQLSGEEQSGDVIENFRGTKAGEGGREVLGVFEEKQPGELLGQRLPSLVLPLPPLSSIT